MNRDVQYGPSTFCSLLAQLQQLLQDRIQHIYQVKHQGYYVLLDGEADLDARAIGNKTLRSRQSCHNQLTFDLVHQFT